MLRDLVIQYGNKHMIHDGSNTRSLHVPDLVVWLSIIPLRNLIDKQTRILNTDRVLNIGLV